MSVDWLNPKLGDLFDFKNGMNAEKAAYGDGIPFVNVMDVFGNDILTADIIRGKIKANAKQINAYLVKYGDILFNRTSETFDEIAMSAVYMDDKEVVFGGFVIRARPKGNLLRPDFCVYFFQSFQIRKELIRRGQGAVRANIGQKDLATVPTILPPLSEQKKIAEILSTWDRAIEVVERLIENSQAQKKALMQQLLTGKKRLPGFDGEWETKTLSQVCEISKGEQKNKDSLQKTGDFPVINGGITPSGYTTESNSPANTITVSEGGNSCGFVNLIKTAFWCGGHCYALKNVKISNAYLYNYLKFQQTKIMRLRVGSGLPNIQKKAIEQVSLYLPPSEEQKKIAKILTISNREIDQLEANLNKLKSEKSALMQQLLTGKRRVKIDEEAAA